MSWFNTNTIHNVLNVAIILLVALLIASGCTQDTVSGAIECSKSWIPASITVWLIGTAAALKVAMNLVRDGLTGLTKPQPPVQK